MSLRTRISLRDRPSVQTLALAALGANAFTPALSLVSGFPFCQAHPCLVPDRWSVSLSNDSTHFVLYLLKLKHIFASEVFEKTFVFLFMYSILHFFFCLVCRPVSFNTCIDLCKPLPQSEYFCPPPPTALLLHLRQTLPHPWFLATTDLFFVLTDSNL